MQLPERQLPLYQHVARQLVDDIRKQPIGAILPTEVDLADNLGVSRHTVRAALGILVDQGLVERVRRMGTRVLRHTPSQRYEQRMDGIDNILEFAGRSIMRIDDVQHIPMKRAVEPDMAGLVDATGECLQVTGVRRLADEDSNSTWTQVFVPGRFAGIEHVLPKETEAMYRIIEKIYRLKVVKLLHNITAIALPAYAAAPLGLPQGSPALQVRAWLYSQDDDLVEYVCSIHNPDKVSISMSTVQSS